jgi:hypothetical protein
MPTLLHLRNTVAQKASKPIRTTSFSDAEAKDMAVKRYIVDAMVSKRILSEKSNPVLVTEFTTELKLDKTFQTPAS